MAHRAVLLFVVGLAAPMASAALAACPVGTAAQNKTLATGQSYRACAIAKARKLERSHESADNLATAAVASCNEARQAYADALTGCQGFQLSGEILAQIDPRLRAEAIAAVVQIIAARNSN